MRFWNLYHLGGGFVTVSSLARFLLLLFCDIYKEKKNRLNERHWVKKKKKKRVFFTSWIFLFWKNIVHLIGKKIPRIDLYIPFYPNNEQRTAAEHKAILVFREYLIIIIIHKNVRHTRTVCCHCIRRYGRKKINKKIKSVHNLDLDHAFFSAFSVHNAPRMQLVHSKIKPDLHNIQQSYHILLFTKCRISPAT